MENLKIILFDPSERLQGGGLTEEKSQPDGSPPILPIVHVWLTYLIKLDCNKQLSHHSQHADMNPYCNQHTFNSIRGSILLTEHPVVHDGGRVEAAAPEEQDTGDPAAAAAAARGGGSRGRSHGGSHGHEG